jgi:addiction module HigA family antidote
VPSIITTANTHMSTHTRIKPTHPGIVLHEEFLKPYGISAVEITKATGIPGSRLCKIFAGERSISADTAIRIGRFLGLNPQGFINMQASYDRIMAEIEIASQRPPLRIAQSPKVLAQLAAA